MSRGPSWLEPRRRSGYSPAPERPSAGAGEGVDESHAFAAAELVEGGGEGLRRVGRFELETHVLGDDLRLLAGAGGVAVAGAEPVTIDGEARPLRSPAAEGE